MIPASASARAGSMVVGMIFLALIVAAVTVVMAISNQGSSTRAVATNFIHGRYAIEIAESCIAEALAEFDDAVQLTTNGRDLRANILNLGRSGALVAGKDIIGVETLQTDPVRTRGLTTWGQGFKISPVTIHFLDYSIFDAAGKPANKGRIEFTATVSSSEKGGRVLSRTVTWRHNIALRLSGTSFRLEQVPFQVLVDRRGS